MHMLCVGLWDIEMRIDHSSDPCQRIVHLSSTLGFRTCSEDRGPDTGGP